MRTPVGHAGSDEDARRPGSLVAMHHKHPTGTLLNPSRSIVQRSEVFG